MDQLQGDRAETQDPTQPLQLFVKEDPQVDAENESSRKRLATDEFLRRARERFKRAAEAENLQRTRSLEEVDFNSGNHWDAADRKARESADQVVLEVNRTPQYLNQVANEQRMTRPQILVRPTGSNSEVETAKVKQGIIRSVERRSGAEGIRDDAFYRMLEKGWAYYRVIDEFENARSFKRIFKTKPFENDFAVYRDPAAVAFDYSDAGFYFVVDDMPTEEFKAEYPEAKLSGLDSFVSLGDDVKYWIGNGTIRVAEYYYKVREQLPLYALPGKRGKFFDELTDDDKTTLLRDERGHPITRPSIRETVYWAKITAMDVLVGNDELTAGRRILGNQVPIIPVLGRRIRVDGKYVYTGMVRDAIQPCLAADYWLSAITEMVALAPKAPYKAAYRAVARYKEQWDTANVSNWATLYYDHIDEQGNPLPAPEREFAKVDIAAMTFILKYADEDLKRVMGIYNAGLGAPGPETSGIAIGARQKESDVANYNYIDNLKRSIAYEAQIYLGLMPEVLDEEQVIEMIRPDGKTDFVAINTMFPDPKTGEEVFHDMRSENYDIDVEVGPSYDTKRQETAAGIMEYLKVDPGAAPIVGDLVADNMDFNNKDLLKERLKIRAGQVAPGIVEDDDSNAPKVPPKFMAQYQQQAKMLEQITQQAEQMKQVIDQKQIEFDHQRALKAMELASLERRAALTAETAALQVASKEDLALLQQAFDKLNLDIAQIQKPGPVEFDFDHENQQLVPKGQGVPPPQQQQVQPQAAQ